MVIQRISCSWCLACSKYISSERCEGFPEGKPEEYSRVPLDSPQICALFVHKDRGEGGGDIPEDDLAEALEYQFPKTIK